MSTNSVSNINENIKTFNSIALDDDILQMYLKDVGKTKMINHQEELRLAKLIAEGKSLEDACNEMMQGVRDCLDEGLEDTDIETD